MPPDTTGTTGAGEGDAIGWEAAQPAADPPYPFDVFQLDEHIRAASAGAMDDGTAAMRERRVHRVDAAVVAVLPIYDRNL